MTDIHFNTEFFSDSREIDMEVATTALIGLEMYLVIDPGEFTSSKIISGVLNYGHLVDLYLKNWSCIIA